jgi:hypothetical protein
MHVANGSLLGVALMERVADPGEAFGGEDRNSAKSIFN